MEGIGKVLLGLVIAVVIAGLASVFVLDIVNDKKADFTVNSTAYNATVQTEQAIAEVPDQLDTVVDVGILAILLTLFIGLGALGYGYGKKSGWF